MSAPISETGRAKAAVRCGAARLAAVAAVALLSCGAPRWAAAQPTPSARGALGAAAPAAATPPTANSPSAAQPGAPATANPPPVQAPAAQAGNGQEVLTLKDLGANSPIRLLGTDGEGSLPFSIRSDQRVTGGKVDLSFAYSPDLIERLSHLTVLLNGEVLGSIPLPKSGASGQTASLPINPALVRPDNRVLFRFIGNFTLGCENPLDPKLWLVLSNTSAVTLQLQNVRLANDLALLPAPFYDSRAMGGLTLPFVFAGRPSPEILQPAGVVASWFGKLASYKGATFPVTFDSIPDGNAVVIATANEKPAGLDLPAISGPTLSVVSNPKNPDAKLLLVLGRTPQELAAAAQTLTLGSTALSGESQVVGAPNIPERKPYDAPAWIPTDRPVRFGELTQPSNLQGSGLVPGLLTVNFRTAPDIFVWGNTSIPMVVRYRFPGGQWLNLGGSRLDASINNSYLSSLPLKQDGAIKQIKTIVSSEYAENQQTVQIPPYYIFGQNQLQFYYLLKPHVPATCAGQLPVNLQESIDPDSTIDLSNTVRFATLPNLAYFVNSGFPFTKWADLSHSAVVLPDQLTPADVETYLTVMGMMGDSTGYPVVRVSIVTPSQVDRVADKDLIVLGSMQRQPLVARWVRNGRLQVQGNQLRMAQSSSMDQVYRVLDPNAARERARVDQLLAQEGGNQATLIGMESPLNSGKTVIIITGSTPEKQMTVLNAFHNRNLNPLIQGDLAVVEPEKVTSFRVGTEYSTGTLPTITRLRWWFGNSPLLLIICTLVGVLIIALVAYWVLSRIAARRLAA